MPVPSLQKPAPVFKGTAVVNGMFKDISLEDYKGQYVVLFFYPLDFTFVCPTEIIAFSDRFEEFKKINTAVVACSTDSQFSHLAWINTPRKQGGLGEMAIPLLSDKSGAVAKAYGVLDEETGIPFRGLFIIDGKGNLRQITINDLPVGRSIDETLRLVQAFQFTDEHGEVCPVGWKPGQKTMKPDPTGSKDYFSTVNKN
ncbi:peroxiredoxin 1 [Diabrotica virgifera virgifera]|uniref:thioredoxin-dependent peroxiredoxin n=1 Tax=Diabrotica virgifera virgifera TaxID=50390 RepID=A0A6P7GEH9_DIAVI|nr:peroxiredoxin 1 [Diabrotica virgifera virgifera]